MRSSDPPRRATYADLERVPPEKVTELIKGVLYVNPRRQCATRARLRLWAVYSTGRSTRDGVGPEARVILDEPELAHRRRPPRRRARSAVPFEAIELELGILWMRRAPC
jgi:hypothetical protein